MLGFNLNHVSKRGPRHQTTNQNARVSSQWSDIVIWLMQWLNPNFTVSSGRMCPDICYRVPLRSSLLWLNAYRFCGNLTIINTMLGYAYEAISMIMPRCLSQYLCQRPMLFPWPKLYLCLWPALSHCLLLCLQMPTYTCDQPYHNAYV